MISNLILISDAVRTSHGRMASHSDQLCEKCTSWSERLRKGEKKGEERRQLG